MFVPFSSRQESRFDLPGFTLPLTFKPWGECPEGQILFSYALNPDDYACSRALGRPFTERETSMMVVMDTITDEPEWDRKFSRSRVLVGCHALKYDSPYRYCDLSPAMRLWIVREVLWKAEFYREKGFVTVIETGVVKSDVAVPGEMRQALRQAVSPLEQVPEQKKDYHPGSNNTVVDLVHPSLYPVVYGRTCILPDKLIGVDDCLDYVGEGEVLADIEDDGTDSQLNWYSRKFQWLPRDVEITEDGGCRILSYINKAHPVKLRELYDVVEMILPRVIPLWDYSLSCMQFFYERIPRHIQYLSHSNSEPEDNTDPAYFERLSAWQKSRSVKLPEPDNRTHIDMFYPRYHGRLERVIVKLANIELNPEKPDYGGDQSLHFEGQLNEHICVTAIYDYDSENVEPSSLAFRQRADTEAVGETEHDEMDHSFLLKLFGFGPDVVGNDLTQVTQGLGSVKFEEGRLLTFPNTLQHRLRPFGLKDRSKPGHRKILTLFLVDPSISDFFGQCPVPARKLGEGEN